VLAARSGFGVSGGTSVSELIVVPIHKSVDRVTNMLQRTISGSSHWWTVNALPSTFGSYLRVGHH
jgi:hypothetical protein